MTDHGQTFTLITNSKFEEDGRSQSRYTGIYGVLSEISPFLFLFFNIAVKFFKKMI